MKTLADIFGSSELPAMLVIASDDTATEVVISEHVDMSSGKKISLFTNVEDPYSPVSGEKVGISGEEVASASRTVDKKEALSAFVCVASCLKCNKDTYTTPDLATDLDAKAISCISCGEPVDVFYDGDLLVDTAEDDEVVEEEEEEEEVTENPDEETDTEVVDVVEENPEDETTEENVEEIVEPTPEEETEEEVVDENIDADEVENDPDAEEDIVDSLEDEASVTFALASLASFDERLRLAFSSEIAGQAEVFIGKTHIGSLIKEEASDSVQRIFDKHDALKTSFSKVFWNAAQEIASGETESIDDFGFNPATVIIPVDSAVEKLATEKASEATEKAETIAEETKDAVVASVKVAMAGIDKGLLNGPSLVSEVAALLTRYGVANSGAQAVRFANDFSSKFLTAVTAAAEDLRGKSPDYVSGLADSIERASYQVNSSDVNKEEASLITSAITTPAPVAHAPSTIKNVEIASVEPNPASSYQAVFRRLRNKR